MQAKDVPDVPVLRFLRDLDGKWASWFAQGDTLMPTVATAMPIETPEKVRLAKMRQLIKRGLVDGCDCGCRGDFVITTAGRAFLDALPEPPQ